MGPGGVPAHLTETRNMRNDTVNRLTIMASISGLALGISPAAATPAKPSIVLVHGAFEDASVWRGVEAGLRKDGYQTVAVDLPGRPSNPAEPSSTSLNGYRDVVLAAVAKTPGRVILVGHSFGGVVIAAAAEAAPEKIRTLVFLAALLPRSGDSLVKMTGQDHDATIGRSILFDDETGLASIAPDARGDLFFNDATPVVQAAASSSIIPEPMPPLAEAVVLTAERFGRVDRTYIHTTRDHVVSPAAQDAMVAATPVRLSFTLQTGHAPFVTDVPGVVDAIERSAK